MRMIKANIFSGFTIGLVTVLFFVTFAPGVSAIPTAENIIILSQKASQIADDFLQETVEIRLTHEYYDGFSNDADSENLHRLSKQASSKLQEVLSSQQQIKKQIENYGGDDWELIFGSTGLWRKISADCINSIYLKSSVDYFVALASGQQQESELLLNTLNSFNQDYDIPAARLLQARVLMLARSGHSSYAFSAAQILDNLLNLAYVTDDIYLKALIERLKLSSAPDLDMLQSLNSRLSSSSYKDDMELGLVVAFVNLRLNRPDILEDAIKRWPQAKPLVGKLLLEDLITRLNENDLSNLSAFEARLVAQTASQLKPENYEILLKKLSSLPDFQSPSVLYFAAIAVEESDPEKAVSLLIKAGRLQGLDPDDYLDLSSEQIARRAAELAYKIYLEKDNFALAAEAIENYFRLAGQQAAPQLEYSYTHLLKKLGEDQQAWEFLQKIASRPKGEFRNAARYDLVIYKLENADGVSPSERAELLIQLRDLISDTAKSPSEHRIHVDATVLYCDLLLAENEPESTEKAYGILVRSDDLPVRYGLILKSRALCQLGRADEAVNVLVLAIEPNSCRNIQYVESLLNQLIEKIDTYSNEANFDQLVKNGFSLGRVCFNCADSKSRAKIGLMYAEFAILASAKDRQNLSIAKELLSGVRDEFGADDTDLLRCFARLHAVEGRFTAAAGEWAKLAGIRKSLNKSEAGPEWKWWRAKFYELDCWSRVKNTHSQDVVHAIEVIENSYENIPQFWGQKLGLLKDNLKIR